MKPVLAQLTRRAIASGYYRSGAQTRLQIADLAARNCEATTYRRLANLGFSPGALVDVGAFRGDWTRLAQRAFGARPTVMVEAQRALMPALEAFAGSDDRLQAVHAVLAATSGEPVDFYEMGTGSSIFGEASNAPRSVAALSTRTLDEVVAATLGEATEIFLKIDVQGAELEVLRGGAAVLARCALVQLEVALLRYNRGAPLMHEVVAWMAERGWYATEISGFSRPAEHLVQVDLIFARDASPLRPDYFEF